MSEFNKVKLRVIIDEKLCRLIVEESGELALTIKGRFRGRDHWMIQVLNSEEFQKYWDNMDSNLWALEQQ
jgi:hypothetical protein